MLREGRGLVQGSRSRQWCCSGMGTRKAEWTASLGCLGIGQGKGLQGQQEEPSETYSHRVPGHQEAQWLGHSGAHRVASLQGQTGGEPKDPSHYGNRSWWTEHLPQHKETTRTLGGLEAGNSA